MRVDSNAWIPEMPETGVGTVPQIRVQGFRQIQGQVGRVSVVVAARDAAHRDAKAWHHDRRAVERIMRHALE
jgi:hypothetical protein